MKPGFLLVLLLISANWTYSQNKETMFNQPKNVIVNGEIDSFGYFRFYNQEVFFENLSFQVKEKIDGDFYFLKEMFDLESGKKYTVVYSFYEYSAYFKNIFNDSLSIKDIKYNFQKTDSISKSDLWKIKNVVNIETFNQIQLLDERSFFKKHFTKEGVIINYNNEQEQLSIMLRALKMNIPISVACVSGDLIIPTKNIGLPVW